MLLVGISMLAGCADPGERAMAECRERYDDYEPGQPEAAAEAEQACRVALDQHGVEEAALLAAKVAFFDGRYDEVEPYLQGLSPGSITAQIQVLLGYAALVGGEAERALQWYEAASYDCRLGHAWGVCADVEYRIADIVWNGGRFVEAHEHLMRSLTHAEHAGDDAQIFAGRMRLSELFVDIGASRLAKTWLEHARRSPTAEEPTARAQILSNEGFHAFNDGQHELAGVAFEQALVDFEGEQAWFEARSTHLNLAEVALELGHVEQARRHLDAAVDIQTRLDVAIGSNQLSSAVHYGALVELADGNPQRALERLEGLPAEDTPLDWAWKLHTARGRASVALGRVDEAEAAFRSAVETVEALRTESELVDYRHWVAEHRREPYELLFRRLVKRGAVDEAIEVFELARARAFAEAFVSNRIESTDAEHELARMEGLAELGTPWTEHEGSTTEKLDALMGLPVIAHFVTEAETYELRFDGASWSIRGLGVGRDELRTLVADALAEEPGWTRLEGLLEPAGLSPGGPLLLVTEPELERIPFAALRWGGEPIVARHELALMPSLTAAAAWRRVEEVPRGDGLVVADTAGDLPRARASGQRIAAELDLPLALGPDASRSLLSELDGGLLHLSVHTGTDERGAWLRLASERAYASEIATWPRAPQTVVLAGCRSALDDEPGVWGALPAAFMASGSRTVVATLRPVRDEDAERVVASFYAEGGRLEPVGALARAQRALAAEGWERERWSPYIAIGIPEESKPDPTSTK